MIPFRGPFHAIVAFDVIEHVPDLDAIAKFVHSELDAHGVFVFVVPVYDGPLGGLVRRLDKDPTHMQKNPVNSGLRGRAATLNQCPGREFSATFCLEVRM